jgi:acyl CoA:acetate/3-ketoacid CoA transferase beta subunit
LMLVEIADGEKVENVRRKTGAPFLVSESLRTF